DVRAAERVGSVLRVVSSLHSVVGCPLHRCPEGADCRGANGGCQTEVSPSKSGGSMIKNVFFFPGILGSMLVELYRGRRYQPWIPGTPWMPVPIMGDRPVRWKA